MCLFPGLVSFGGKGVSRNMLQLTQIIQTLLTACKEEQLVDSSSFSDVRTSNTVSSDVSNLDSIVNIVCIEVCMVVVFCVCMCEESDVLSVYLILV